MTTTRRYIVIPLLLAAGCAPFKEPVHTPGAPKPIAPYSPGIVSGDFVFVSGQGPVDPITQKYTPADIKAETKLTLENIKAILEAAGSSLDKVVKVNVYLTDIKNFAGMNEVYGQYFKPPAPARATVQVAALPLGIQVEIECIARR
jgi:2-iminobutanoate/2-iminopropanoate deaminase